MLNKMEKNKREIFKKCVQEELDYDWDAFDEYLDGYGWSTMFEIAKRFADKLNIVKE